MKQKEQQTFSVRMERIPSRLVLERMRETYRRLYQAADSVENEKPIQEAQHEREFDPSSGSDLCQGSTLQQEQEATIDSQVTELEKYAQEKGRRLSKEFYFLDQAVSGAQLPRPALDRLRDLAVEGLYLNENIATMPLCGKRWYPGIVQTILSQPAYMGKTHYNRTCTCYEIIGKPRRVGRGAKRYAAHLPRPKEVQTNPNAPDEPNRLPSRLKALENQWQRLPDLFQQEKIDKAELSKRKARIDQERASIQTRLEQFDHLAQQKQIKQAIVDDFETFCQKVNASMENPTPQLQQEVIRLLVDHMVVGKDEIVIKHIVPADDNGRLLPGRNETALIRDPIRGWFAAKPQIPLESELF